MQQQTEMNEGFEMAADFVLHTNRSVFLTGKAGTGKTTFLKHITAVCHKEFVVTAPTGVAAINCNGATLHSVFQLPFGAFIPGTARGFSATTTNITDKHSLFKNTRFSQDKRELFNKLELLIIDEVSMLRADMLDAVDIILRSYRKRISEPFGGVQVLFIGDLYQLPPVVNNEEWEFLKDYYTSPFFFDALALKENPPLCLTLEKIYRQQNTAFIELLNRIRNNELEPDDYSLLQQKVQDQLPERHTDYVVLTTHNAKADSINQQELNRLAGKQYLFEATVLNDFPEKMYPLEPTLVLKIGTRVMFIKNDAANKRWFNGKMATVQRIFYDKEQETNLVEVLTDGDHLPIILEKENWNNTRYFYNETEDSIDEEILGSFTQYPIRLAWAITIHKSQGLTFEKAIIDAGRAFAAGQVYVALSRCVALDGIILLSHITPTAVSTNPLIKAYMQQQEYAHLPEMLKREKEAYFIKRSQSKYEFSQALRKMQQLLTFMQERNLANKEEVIQGILEITDALKNIERTAQKFREQVKLILAVGISDQVMQQLTERCEKADQWFGNAFKEQVLNPFEGIASILLKEKKARRALAGLYTEIKWMRKLKEKFIPEHVTIPLANEKVEANISLLQLLKNKRRELAGQASLPEYRVCNNATLLEIETYLPQNMMEMSGIKGMGDYTLTHYGETFLQIVIAYSKAHQLQSRMQEKKGRQQAIKHVLSTHADTKHADTKTQSFILYQAGQTIAEIAAARGLSPGTIESHLSSFIADGRIDIYSLITKAQYDQILVALQSIATDNKVAFAEAKIKLGDAVSYAAMRWVWAHWQYQQEQLKTTELKNKFV